LVQKAGQEPPSLGWGTVIGEIVHNLASALDNLVFELAQVNPRPPPVPTTPAEHRAWNAHLRTQGFPCCKSRKVWKAQVDRYLYFVDRSLDAVFEELQPFYAWENDGIDPEHFPLAVVHELWNRDKHRTVNLATAGASLNFTNVRIPELFPDHSQLPFELGEVFPHRPIKGKTEVAHIFIRFPREVALPETDPVKIHVYVKPQITLAILFGQGAPGEGDDALDMLRRARDKTVEILNLFA
jgi:hypothetical protein